MLWYVFVDNNIDKTISFKIFSTEEDASSYCDYIYCEKNPTNDDVKVEIGNVEIDDPDFYKCVIFKKR